MFYMPDIYFSLILKIRNKKSGIINFRHFLNYVFSVFLFSILIILVLLESSSHLLEMLLNVIKWHLLLNLTKLL